MPSTVDLAITLPTGITFNTGTAEVGLGADQASAIAAIAAVADPAISGGTITFYDFNDKGNNIAACHPGGRRQRYRWCCGFPFSPPATPPPTLDSTCATIDCCDDRQYSTTTEQQLTALFPSLTVSKTPISSQVDCGANQTWTVTVTNSGTGNAEVVRIEDTLGDWIDYVSSAFRPPLPWAGRYTAGRSTTWPPAAVPLPSPSPGS